PCPNSPKVKTPIPSALPSLGPLLEHRNAYVRRRFSTRFVAGKEVELADFCHQLRASHGPDSAPDGHRSYDLRYASAERELSRNGVDTTASITAGAVAQAQAAAGSCQVAASGAGVRETEVAGSGGSPCPQAEATGDFGGSSAPPTVNAPISKVQTGGFGDPNGLKPSDNGKPNGKLVAAVAGSFDMPVGPGQGNGSGGAKGIKGTVASADFGSGVATAGQGDGRRSGRGVQASNFGSQVV